MSASNPAATQALNIAATSHLAAVCNARKIFLLYISTDYVFSGVEGEAPYEVDSQTAPPNFYGETKLKGEEAVREEIERGLRGVVLRVPVLYGETESGNKESAVNVLLDLVWNKEGKEKVSGFVRRMGEMVLIIRDRLRWTIGVYVTQPTLRMSPESSKTLPLSTPTLLSLSSRNSQPLCSFPRKSE